MPTKDQLVDALAEANAKIAELEAAPDDVPGDAAELVWNELHGWCWRTEEDGEWPCGQAVVMALDKAGVVGDGQTFTPETPLRTRVVAMAGDEPFKLAEAQAFTESGLSVDGWEELTEDEKLDAALHVLLRPVTTDDGAEPENAGDGAVAAELQRVTIERDDARHKLAQVTERLNAAIALHGKVDNLPPVV